MALRRPTWVSQGLVPPEDQWTGRGKLSSRPPIAMSHVWKGVLLMDLGIEGTCLGFGLPLVFLSSPFFLNLNKGSISHLEMSMGVACFFLYLFLVALKGKPLGKPKPSCPLNQDEPSISASPRRLAGGCGGLGRLMQTMWPSSACTCGPRQDRRKSRGLSCWVSSDAKGRE